MWAENQKVNSIRLHALVGSNDECNCNGKAAVKFSRILAEINQKGVTQHDRFLLFPRINMDGVEWCAPFRFLLNEKNRLSLGGTRSEFSSKGEALRFDCKVIMG